MKYKYYPSDFSLLVEVRASYINEASQQVDITTGTPFELVFWTDKNKNIKYSCSSDGKGVTKNCTVVDGSHVMVYFDQKVQCLGLGHLLMECHFFIPNAHFEDGVMDIKRFYNTGVILTDIPELENESAASFSIDLVPIILNGENTPVETSLDFVSASDVLRKKGRVHARNGVKYPSVTTEDNVICSDGRGLDEHNQDIKDNLGYFVCNSAANDATKIVASGLLKMGHQAGMSQKVKMNFATNVACKYKIGNGPEHVLIYNGKPANAYNTWADGDILEIWCDGTFAYAKKWQGGNAKDIQFDNTGTKFQSNTVQGAIEEGERELNQLALKTKEVERKTKDIENENTEETVSEVDFYNDDKTERLHHIGEDGADFKNLKSNGKPVLTEHQDISGLATKEEVENAKIPEISHETTKKTDSAVVITTDDDKPVAEMHAELTENEEECQSWTSDDYDDNGHGEKYVKITPKGISAKGFFDMNGNPIGGSNIKVNQLYAYRQEGTDDATHFYGLNAIKKALASINDSSENNHYVINVRGHFIFNDVSNHDVLMNSKNSSNTWWVNVYGKDYVTLDGGDKEQTSVEMYLSLDTTFPKWDDGVHSYYGGNYHVIFNNALWFECKNITFVGRNTRYCLHNENFNETIGSHQLFENCRFIYGYDNIWTSGNVNVTGTILNGNQVLGCGYRKEGDFHYEDCDVIANSAFNVDTPLVGAHSGYYSTGRSYDKPAKIYFNGCNFEGGKRLMTYSIYEPIGDIFRFTSCNIPELSSMTLSVLQYNNADNPLAYPKVYIDSKPIIVNNGSTTVNVLKIVATSGTSSVIRIDKTCSAFGIIADSINGTDGINEWGAYHHDGYIYKDDEHGLDGYLLGTAGIGKRTLGGILGDCRSSSKTLSISVNGVMKYCTFNTNMTAMSNDDVITYINARLDGVEVSLASIGDYHYATFDYVNLIENSGTKPVKKGMGVILVGNTNSFRIATQADKYVDAICIDDTPVGQVGRIATCGAFALRKSSTAKYVNIKTEDEDSLNGRFFVIGATDGVFKSTSEYSNLKKVGYNEVMFN